MKKYSTVNWMHAIFKIWKQYVDEPRLHICELEKYLKLYYKNNYFGDQDLNEIKVILH